MLKNCSKVLGIRFLAVRNFQGIQDARSSKGNPDFSEGPQELHKNVNGFYLGFCRLKTIVDLKPPLVFFQEVQVLPGLSKSGSESPKPET